MKRIKKFYNDIAECLEQIRLFDLVAFLTAYTLFRISHFPIDMGLSIATAVLTIIPAVRRSHWFWFGIAAVWLPRMYFNFHHYEDHCFFVIYWCAALGFSLIGNRQEFVMRRSARLLIGLCFALGFVWKLVAVEFIDGSLFHFKLLFDYRFAEMITEPVGGVTTAMSNANLDAYHSIRHVDQPGNAISLDIPPNVSVIAKFMTAWTIFIEGLIAAMFLIPRSRIAEKFRDAVLLLFMASTYFIVPVMGFACAFSTLGIAQTRSAKMRLAYILVSCVLFAWYSLRWPIFNALGL